jgi:hypothetical protein
VLDIPAEGVAAIRTLGWEPVEKPAPKSEKAQDEKPAPKKQTKRK